MIAQLKARAEALYAGPHTEPGLAERLHREWAEVCDLAAMLRIWLSWCAPLDWRSHERELVGRRMRELAVIDAADATQKLARLELLGSPPREAQAVDLVAWCEAVELVWAWLERWLCVMPSRQEHAAVDTVHRLRLIARPVVGTDEQRARAMDRRDALLEALFLAQLESGGEP